MQLCCPAWSRGLQRGMVEHPRSLGDGPVATATSPSDVALAHSRPGEPPDRWHRLHEHLAQVAKLASAFADDFGAGEWAKVLGIWHDLGKYDPDFQIYLRRVGGADGHIEAENED